MDSIDSFVSKVLSGLADELDDTVGSVITLFCESSPESKVAQVLFTVNDDGSTVAVTLNHGKNSENAKIDSIGEFETDGKDGVEEECRRYIAKARKVVQTQYPALEIKDSSEKDEEEFAGRLWRKIEKAKRRNATPKPVKQDEKA